MCECFHDVRTGAVAVLCDACSRNLKRGVQLKSQTKRQPVVESFRRVIRRPHERN